MKKTHFKETVVQYKPKAHTLKLMILTTHFVNTIIQSLGTLF